MKKILILILLLPILATAAIYKWIDEDGNMHYSGDSQEGSQKVKIPDIQSYKLRKMPKIKEAEKVKKKAEVKYESIKITTPENDAVVRSNNGNVDVVVEVEPKLTKANLILILLDSKPAHKPQYGNKVTLIHLDRGSHLLQAQILDKKENVIMSSDVIAFHLQRFHVSLKPKK